jgi:hypothetical protein
MTAEFMGYDYDPHFVLGQETVPKEGDALKRALARENFKLEDLHEKCNGWFYDDDAASSKGAVVKDIDNWIRRHINLRGVGQNFSSPAANLRLLITNAKPNGFVRDTFKERNFKVTFYKVARQDFVRDELEQIVAAYGKDQRGWPHSALFYNVSLLPETLLNWQEIASKRI